MEELVEEVVEREKSGDGEVQRPCFAEDGGSRWSEDVVRF